MDNLSEQIINSRWISEIEKHIRAALEDVELIGELPITETAFKKICTVLQTECKFRKRIQKERLYPAIFVTSLVFSGRYSNDETRTFWEYYADDVWDIKCNQSFETACRDYFHELAKPLLMENFGFEFPTIKDGDVVRPVYWHTILPSYLHDDFARWIKKCLPELSSLSPEYVPEFILSESETAHIAGRLKNFLKDESTHETAVQLVNDLISASDLLEQRFPEDEIWELFPSLIHREIWDKFAVELARDHLVLNSSQRRMRLEWVWSFDYEDWILRIVNLITDPDKKPSLCIWSDQPSEEAFWDYHYQEELWAERQTDGQWRVREIVLGLLDSPEMLQSSIYIYDERDACILSLEVPKLPDNEFQFFRITQQHKYAVPIDLYSLANGQYLISYKDGLSLYGKNGLPINHEQTFNVSDVMYNQLGHNAIGLFDITLPLDIKTQDNQYRVEPAKRRNLPQPNLSSRYAIQGLSDSVPPAFSTNKIDLVFPNLSGQVSHLRLHLSTQNNQRYEPLSKYGRQSGTDYIVDLTDLLLSDQIATYELDVTYGFRSRLSSPIEFSVIPNIEIVPPDDKPFTPLDQPNVIIKLTRGIIEFQESLAHRIQSSSNETMVEWTDLRSNICRLQIRQDEQVVPLAWEIRRVYAWVENAQLPKRLLEADLEKSRIEFRGERYQILNLYIDDEPYDVSLNARGKYTIDIRYDRFKDALQNNQSVYVPIELGLDNQRWLLTAFVRRPQVLQVQANYIVDEEQEWLAVDVTLSIDWKTNFEIIVTDKATKEVVIRHTLNNFDGLELIPCQLAPSKYELTLLADGEALELPNEAVLEAPIPQLVSMTVRYDGKEFQATYEIDDIRLGEYHLVIENTHQVTIFIEKLNNVSLGQFGKKIALKTGDYRAYIQWNNKLLNETILFSVSEPGDVASKTVDTYFVKATPSTIITSTELVWLKELIEYPPKQLSSESLFKLATIQFKDIDLFAEEHLKNLWRPLWRIAEVNQPSLWSQRYGLIPSWALLDYTLIMTTNQVTSYWVFPEQVLLGGAMGKGKIGLDTPQEGQIYAYARWSSRGKRTSRLHIWMPPKNHNGSIFSDLDELDMWPAYYDYFTGKFHGSRTKAMIPGLSFSSESKTAVYLHDVAHIYTLVTNVSRTNKPLLHTYGSSTSIDRYYAQAILQERIDALNTKSVSRKIITESDGYRYATLEWVNNYLENKALKQRLKHLVSTDAGDGCIEKFLDQIPRLTQIQNIPLLVGARRFLNGMEKQVGTENENKLMRLDRNLIVLAVILRSYALASKAQIDLIHRELELDESILRQLLDDANQACPSLLEWALTWAEIFAVHSAI